MFLCSNVPMLQVLCFYSKHASFVLLISEPINSGVVAFTATPGALRTYQPEEPVIFDYDFSNFGSAFEPQSSVFTCPVTGVYMFGVNLMSDDGTHAQVALFVDEGFIFNVLADDVSSNVFVGASNFAVTSCSQGQGVWVKTYSRENQKISASRYTTFFGVLIAKWIIIDVCVVISVLYWLERYALCLKQQGSTFHPESHGNYIRE